MNILEEIAERTRQRYEMREKEIPFSQIRSRAEQVEQTLEAFAFEKALSKQDLSFICEVKKASPSKGVIAEHFPYLTIAQEYEAAGADAISCLTEPHWFLGSDAYLKEITDTVKIPVLRKDFTVGDYQIFEAKTLGASAVLLICALLDTAQVRDYIQICDALGLSALVEAHDEKEIESALDAGARIVGVNNRNLKDFSVDVSNSARIRSLVPENVLFVSESGIASAEDVRAVRKSGADAVLVGETLMRAPDKKKKLEELTR
jgi:indole-3-glycerol phosphate synthase